MGGNSWRELDREDRPGRRRRLGMMLGGAGSGAALGALVLGALSGPAGAAAGPVNPTAKTTSLVTSTTSAATSVLGATTAGLANLLTGNQAGFDTGLGGWVGSGAVVSVVSSPVLAGAGAMAVTATSGGTAGAASGTGPASWTPAAAGQVYTAQAAMRGATASRSVETALAFLSSTGTTLGTVWGQLTLDNTIGWTQTTPAVGIAPAGTAYVRSAVLFYGTVAGETDYVDSASVTAHSSGSAPVAGPLHTAGNRVYDVNNRPVTLRGTVSEWLDWNPSVPSGSQLDDNNVANMKRWGDNAVRVLLSENYWNSNDCAYSPGYAGAVDQVVNSITARGMVAILTLHNNGRTPCEASRQQRMADAPGSLTFWQQVATRYRSNPLVAFELYNEPHDITWDQWMNGGSLTDADGVTWQAAGMKQLYNAVRQTGARNLVLVSGNGWASTAPAGAYLLGGSNLVYTAHAYTCPNTTPAGCTTPNPTAVPASLLAWAPLAAVQPVMVSEFGWPAGSGADYDQNVINWAESENIGWTAYAWYKGTTPGSSTVNFGLLADTNSFEPEASGMPVLAGLALNS